jgi:hypothetical protein
MLKLPVPEIRNGKPVVLSAPCSPELKEIVQSLVERADALRLHDARLPDHANSKVNRAVHEIERIWHETAAGRSTQLVFCDLSIPTGGKGFSVYEDMRDKLVSRGILPDEIAFIQDYDSDAAKLALFRDVRAGNAHILFGSTQKMGTGANMQERLIALHHLDAPWRPADVEQREGRILRQGNSNPEIQIY